MNETMTLEYHSRFNINNLFLMFYYFTSQHQTWCYNIWWRQCSSRLLHCVWDILRCQVVKSDMGQPPTGYRTAVTRRGRVVEFLALLPLEAEEWKEWAPFTQFRSSGTPTLIEIDMKKGDKLFSHTLALLSPLLRGIMQTECSDNRQNLMRLFFLSGDLCVLIGVCVQLVFCCTLSLWG